MKRILVCASRISHILNFHLPYLRYFRDKGYIIDAAAEGKTENELIDNCYDMRFVKNPLSPENLRTVSRLKKLMQENEYSLVYSNTTLAGAAAKLAVMRLKKKPYFVHISHGYMFGLDGSIHSRIYRTAEKLTAPAVDTLAVMNSEDYYLAKKYKLGRSINYIYGMGLQKERFSEISDEQRTLVRERAGIGNDKKILLCVGEFSARKNQTMLIKAFDDIHKKHPDTVLAFAGEGKTENECRMLAENLELRDSVKFLGHVSDINGIYRSSYMLVACSKMEGMPFNVMEALYCGLPVAASNIKGHSDLLRKKPFGVLFENNSRSLAAAVDSILSDENKYSEMKNTAFLDERYLSENVMPTVLRLLDREYRPDEKVVSVKGAF
ncbi:MAG: glycosyltransferase [Clostridia bacterium]|nr:glycosyltransferase [Clostridia bacterium]